MDNTELNAQLSENAQLLLKNLQETLNEEKWTRATLGNYSTNQFKELDEILKNARKEKIIEELKKNCDEHLTHTRNSIIALYLSGMIALSRQIIDDSAIINLVSIFLDNHKWSIVKYLCERILDYGESKFALRTLADCYKNDNEEEKQYCIWERLVKVDFEEADICKSLAEYYEKQDKKEEAIDYYKKSLNRYINKASFTNVKEIWEKLLELNVEDIDFFLHIQKKIAKTISEDKAVILLNELYKEILDIIDIPDDEKYRNIDIDTAINILKIILEYDEKDVHGRKEIIECFRKKYASHSQLEEYIRISNLSQNYRAVHQAIADFEKHIAFDKGNFVYHRTWGVGRIALIQGDDIRIDFAKKRGHSMSLKMAVDALQTLSKNHIWVLKATKKKDELREKIKDNDENIIWTLKTIIKSFGNACDMKRIKAELFPALLTAGEWTSWNSKAREILKANPEFGVSPDNSDIFIVRDRPISVTEKLYNEFTAQKNFYDKVSAIREYIDNEEASPDSELFTEMFSYFTEFLGSTSRNVEYSAASYLLINELALNERYSHLKSAVNINFAEIFSGIKDIPSLFKNLKDAKLKVNFLNNIKLYINEWPEIYVNLFPFSQLKVITDQLKEAGFTDKLSVMCNYCFEHHREFREAVVWLYQNSRNEKWFEDANISYEKQLITLIHILDNTYRDIENHKDTVENKKINKLVHNILFKNGALVSFLDTADEDAIIRIFTFINAVKDLDPQDKINLRSGILAKFPGFKFLGETEKKVSGRLIATRAMLDIKQKELENIKNVLIPENSKDIEKAREWQDLRENAEYKAAKETQDRLNKQIATLTEEIERVQIFDPESINAEKITFGTKVVLYNEMESKKEEFTILGPWESDPDNKIISYQSPFGSAMLNKAEGETFIFVKDDEKVSYLVESITRADLSNL